MAVNPKEKKMLQEMWAGAEDASGADLPDGTYQFEILSARFHMTDKNKPQFKTKIKVVGGDEEYVDKELEINDNLETKENMGWFKRKLRRLNITVTDDFDDIIDGTVAEEMEGKTFEGQVKTKNDFLNVYVNRLVSDADGAKTKNKDDDEDKGDKKKEEAEDEDKKSKSKAAFEEGDIVTWGDGNEGEVIEILEDDGKARIKLEDETIKRVKLDELEKKEEKAGKKGEDKSGTFELPAADEVEDMKAPKVREALEELGFEPEDMKDPRGVLRAFCALAEDGEDAELELSEIKPLADALEIELDKGMKMEKQIKALSKGVAEKLG